MEARETECGGGSWVKRSGFLNKQNLPAGGPLTYRARTIPGSRKQKGSSQKPVLGWFGQETDGGEGREGDGS